MLTVESCGLLAFTSSPRFNTTHGELNGVKLLNGEIKWYSFANSKAIHANGKNGRDFNKSCPYYKSMRRPRMRWSP
jgi:hypothetical protein